MNLEQLYNKQKEKESILYGSAKEKALSPLDTRFVINRDTAISLRSYLNSPDTENLTIKNANMLLTEEELIFVAQNNPLKEEMLAKFIPTVKKDKNGNVIEVDFKQNYNSAIYSVMILVAIYHLTVSDENIEKISKNNYVDNRTKLVVDNAMKAYKIPLSQVDKSETYFKKNFIKYRWTDFAFRIMKYILLRWNLKDNQERNCSGTILNMLLKENGYSFTIQPFELAILKTVADINANKKERYELKDFLYKMRYGTRDIAIEEIFGDNDKDESFEPYRDEILTKALLSVLVLQFGNSKEFDFSHVKIDGKTVDNDAQLTLFLQGKQGVGKSTFTNKMALGYAYDLPKLDSSDQEIVLSRANAVIVELGEGLATSKADVKKMKMEQTKREAHINLKYQNGLTEFVYRSLLVVTANNSDLLKDITGERRNYPIRVTADQLRAISMEEMLRLYATLYIDIVNGKQDYNLYLEEKEEWLNYKRDLFGQTDASLSVLCEWLLNKITRREIEFITTRNGFIYLPGRREMQKIINTDIALKGIYADKLLEFLANIPETKMGIQYQNHGKRKIRMSLKELSIALTDSETELVDRLNNEQVLKMQDLIAVVVHDMLAKGLPTSIIARRLAIPEDRAEMIEQTRYNPDWFKL